MPRYGAFLRGANEEKLTTRGFKHALEQAGFGRIAVFGTKGTALFDADETDAVAVEKMCQVSMNKHLGKKFLTFVRDREALNLLVASNPYAMHRVPLDAKRSVSFLKEVPAERPPFPIDLAGAAIVGLRGKDVFSWFSNAEGKLFISPAVAGLFGTRFTTRSWDTIVKMVHSKGAKSKK